MTVIELPAASVLAGSIVIPGILSSTRLRSLKVTLPVLVMTYVYVITSPSMASTTSAVLSTVILGSSAGGMTGQSTATSIWFDGGEPFDVAMFVTVLPHSVGEAFTFTVTVATPPECGTVMGPQSMVFAPRTIDSQETLVTPPVTV